MNLSQVKSRKTMWNCGKREAGGSHSQENSGFIMWLHQLPSELSQMILALLPLKDIEQCSLVCKQWRQHIHRSDEKSKSFLTAPPVLHTITLHSYNVLPFEREPGLYALHPIVNVGNDFFVFERKANERFASAVHVVNKCDYEGSVKLTKQTIWLVPCEVLSVDQVFTVYSKPGSLFIHASPEERESCFSMAEIFERKTFSPLPWHEALTNVVAMCQKDNIILHLCLFKAFTIDSKSANERRFVLFALRNFQWQELVSTTIVTQILPHFPEGHKSLCGLNLMRCRPHMQMENSHVMWTCGTHANRLFLANLVDKTVTTIELNEYSFKNRWDFPFKCPTALFEGNIIGMKITQEGRGYAEFDLINISTNQVLQNCPKSRNIQQVCSEQFLVYIMEMYSSEEYLLLCIDRRDFGVRKATFPYYPHGIYNDIRMVVDESRNQLLIHAVSNEVVSSLRCSNHVFVFDLTRDDLYSGMRVFNLGISHYAPAISVASGLIMHDLGFVQMDANNHWFRAIAVGSITAHGFAQHSQKHKGTRGMGSLADPVYLYNCKPTMWTRQSETRDNVSCLRCSFDSIYHHSDPLGRGATPLRMDPSVFLGDDAMRDVIFDGEGQGRTIVKCEEQRERILRAKANCVGFWPKLDDQILISLEKELLDGGEGTYLPCEADGRTCIHDRWK